MSIMGKHSEPLNGTVANGHALRPFTFPAGPVSGWPQDGGGQPQTPADTRTAADKRRRRLPDGTVFIAVALVAVAQVAVVAFSGSWQHQYELSVRLGQAHWVAGMQPLSVEGLIVSATLVIWYAGRHGYRRRDVWGAYAVLAAGVAQSVLMNLGADSPWPWLRLEISVWPAVAFFAGYEMAVWLVRQRQDGGGMARAGDSGRARSGQPGKNGGEGTGLAGSLRVEVAAVTAPSAPVDKRADKRAGADVDNPQARADRQVDKSGPRGTAMDKAAAAVRDNPGLAEAKAWTALAGIAGVSAKTVRRYVDSQIGDRT